MDEEQPKTAAIYHVFDDQGGGGAFCDNCHAYLGANPRKLPEICPKCKSVFGVSKLTKDYTGE